MFVYVGVIVCACVCVRNAVLIDQVKWFCVWVTMFFWGENPKSKKDERKKKKKSLLTFCLFPTFFSLAVDFSFFHLSIISFFPSLLGFRLWSLSHWMVVDGITLLFLSCSISFCCAQTLSSRNMLKPMNHTGWSGGGRRCMYVYLENTQSDF